MLPYRIASLGLLAVACSAPAPLPSNAAAVVVPGHSSEGDAGLADAATTATTAIATSRATLDPFEVSNAGVGFLLDEVEASEETLTPLFDGCTVDWQRHKGKATPHFQVKCDGLHVMDVVLREQASSGRINYVSVYKEGVATPSGLSVGSSYQALADLSGEMNCRGVKGGSGGPGVIVRAHTLCVSPLFPRVAYVFRNVVFDTGETPPSASELRIGEVRWTP